MATATRVASLITRAAPGVTRKLLAIGDSTTVAGRWLAEVVCLSLAAGGSVTTAGRLSVSAPDALGTSRTLKHEAVSRQDVNYFYSNASSPFVFGGVFNYASYLAANPSVVLASGDWVTIHLGINDWMGFTSDSVMLASTAIPDRITKLEAMIQSIKAAVPGIRIGIMLTIPPASSQDAWGAAYALGQNARRYRRNRDLWVRALLLAFDGRTSESIYVAPTHACLDPENGYPVAAASPRNAYDTTLVTRGNNAVHPADSRYWQMDAAVYALLRGVEG